MPQFCQLAAITFTSIVGYTALMGDDEQKAFELKQRIYFISMINEDLKTFASE